MSNPDLKCMLGSTINIGDDVIFAINDKLLVGTVASFPNLHTVGIKRIGFISETFRQHGEVCNMSSFKKEYPEYFV